MSVIMRDNNYEYNSLLFYFFPVRIFSAFLKTLPEKNEEYYALKNSRRALSVLGCLISLPIIAIFVFLVVVVVILITSPNKSPLREEIVDTCGDTIIDTEDYYVCQYLLLDEDTTKVLQAAFTLIDKVNKNEDLSFQLVDCVLYYKVANDSLIEIYPYVKGEHLKYDTSLNDVTLRVRYLTDKEFNKYEKNYKEKGLTRLP